MSDVETLFVSWPVGIALSCWLFFEITKLGPCLEQSVVPRRVVARSWHLARIMQRRDVSASVCGAFW